MFWFFGHKACGILAPQPGIRSAPLALEGKVLTTGLPGKSHRTIFLSFFLFFFKVMLMFFDEYPRCVSEFQNEFVHDSSQFKNFGE